MLSNFLLRLTDGDVADPMTRDGKIDLARQTLLQEQGVIDLVARLVQYPFQVGPFSSLLLNMFALN